MRDAAFVKPTGAAEMSQAVSGTASLVRIEAEQVLVYCGLLRPRLASRARGNRARRSPHVPTECTSPMRSVTMTCDV